MDDQVKDTEQRILEAAIREFAAKGFDGARTTAIASQAGVTHAMLHYYFRSKENLFGRIFKDKMQYLLNMVLGVFDESGSIKERVRRGVAAHFDFLLANSDLPMFFLSTINSRPDIFESLKNEIFNVAYDRLCRLQDVFDVAADAGEIVRVDVPMLMLDIVSLNIFPFMGYRAIKSVLGLGDEDYMRFMEAKKHENIEVIMCRISKPKS